MVDVKKDKKPKTDKSEVKAIAKTEEKSSAATFKPGAISYADGSLLIPPGLQTKLNSIGQKFGVPFDLANISIGDGSMADKVKALTAIADMAANDSALLPEMLKLIKSLLRSDIKLAKFHQKLTKAAIKHQVKLDKVTADIAVQMAGFEAKSGRLAQKTNSRIKIIEKRSQLYAEHYENSVFGNESKIIDVEFELKATNSQALAASKEKKLDFDAKRKQASIDYVNQVLED